MRGMRLIAMLAATLAPVAAQAQDWRADRGEVREERRDLREERRESRDAYRAGDPRAIRDERRDVYRAEREYRDARRDWRDDRREWDRRDWRDDRFAGQWRGDWDRRGYHGWQGRNRDWFRGPRYVAPFPGWSFRPVAPGFALAPPFFGPRYVIGDFRRYGLPFPPAFHRWVRYGPDILLVDTRRGIVRDVIRGVFW